MRSCCSSSMVQYSRPWTRCSPMGRSCGWSGVMAVRVVVGPESWLSERVVGGGVLSRGFDCGVVGKFDCGVVGNCSQQKLRWRLFPPFCAVVFGLRLASAACCYSRFRTERARERCIETGDCELMAISVPVGALQSCSDTIDVRPASGIMRSLGAELTAALCSSLVISRLQLDSKIYRNPDADNRKPNKQLCTTVHFFLFLFNFFTTT